MAREAASPDAPAAVKPAPLQKNLLRRTALVVVLIAIALFALSVVMERLTPTSSPAAVQAYIVRMAPEVSGRVLEVGVRPHGYSSPCPALACSQSDSASSTLDSMKTTWMPTSQ